MIWGADIGYRVNILRDVPPPLMRLLAGSSVMEAPRAWPPPEPDIPRTPAKAPVPPITAKLTPDCAAGAPGGGAPLDSPIAIMLPTVFPEASKISKTSSRIAARTTSPIAPPGLGFGFVTIARARATYRPFTG